MNSIKILKGSMIIFSYNILQIIFFPIIFFIAFFRIIFNKENFTSFGQKFLCKYNFSQLDNFDYLIHFASIGELNSINYLIENLSSKKILLTCSTLSSYNLAKKSTKNIQLFFYP